MSFNFYYEKPSGKVRLVFRCFCVFWTREAFLAAMKLPASIAATDDYGKVAPLIDLCRRHDSLLVYGPHPPGSWIVSVRILSDGLTSHRIFNALGEYKLVLCDTIGVFEARAGRPLTRLMEVPLPLESRGLEVCGV